MSNERPYLQIPLSTHEDFVAYEEWLKKQKEASEEEESDKNENGVITIQM